MTTTAVACPKCGGGCFDNRAENDARLARGEKIRPDFKCRDRNCDGVIWRPKNGAQAAPPPAQPYAAPAPPPVQAVQHAAHVAHSLDAVTAAAEVCFNTVLQQSERMAKSGVGDSPEAASARFATLLIQACGGKR